MCCVVKRAVLLLLLAAVIGSDPVPVPEDCEGLKTPLPSKDLHKVFGDWVLVWSIADHPQGWDLLPNVTSSHVELQLLADNKTIVFTERNLYTDKSCATYVINMSMPSDPSDSEHHTLPTESATVEKDGVVQPYNDSGVVDVYESCADCLVVIYKNIHGQYLLIYRREGHHLDAEQLKADHGHHRKQAECLGLPHDKPFIYDGAADFCHKKSSPERAVLLLLLAAVIGSDPVLVPEDCEGLNKPLPRNDLHKIFGDWVLVWSVCDPPIAWYEESQIKSSHVEFRLLPDNKTIVFNERNLLVGNSCSNFIFNMSVSSEPSHNHTLLTDAATMEVDGTVQPFNYTGVLELYESCPDCLVMVNKGSIFGQFLMIYRREGHHLDFEKLKADHGHHRKRADCLGFSDSKPFIYDGAADFCHKKSSPEVKQES
ncbi:saxitoxin and tetrodotoxin-binding protein 2 [Lates calcarifer]|uniref:Saxitoxin and tetrodotoxin-binding protein 2 n=1 Tax=Lates calcarifer TaxID=8187 RepID=A0AAJ8B4J8_LATCA|nr:saxitoxin and tetrodotoxin-binding protein 2 [Lates calcarifer]